VVLEGADGSGKSTQARRLATTLGAGGRRVVHVRDPGGTRLAEAVRGVLLDPAVGPVGVAAETLLYLAARAQLAEEVIGPALAEGAVVVSERWTLSTEAYQGLAGGFGAERVRQLAALACGGCEPDLVLVLDVAAGAGLARLGRPPDRMEAKGEAFHRRVVEAYRELAAPRASHVLVPPGDLDAVAVRVLGEVERQLG